MVIATWAASTWPATGITATAAIVLRIVLRVLVTLVHGAMVIVTLVASTRSATGIMATAAIVLTIVLRVPAARLRLPIATVGATETATAAASTRRATLTTAIVAIFLRPVT
jgi:hypothetical protein